MRLHVFLFGQPTAVVDDSLHRAGVLLVTSEENILDAEILCFNQRLSKNFRRIPLSSGAWSDPETDVATKAPKEIIQFMSKVRHGDDIFRIANQPEGAVRQEALGQPNAIRVALQHRDVPLKAASDLCQNPWNQLLSTG